MSNEKNGLADDKKIKSKANFLLSNFSSVIVDGLLDEQEELYNNNTNTTKNSSGTSINEKYCESGSASAPTFQVNGAVEGLPRRRGSILTRAPAAEYEEDNASESDEVDSCFGRDEGNGNENDADGEASASITTCTSSGERFINLTSTLTTSSSTTGALGNNGTLIKQQHNQHSYLEIQSASSSPIVFLSSSGSSPRSGHSSWEADQQGTSLESASSCWTVSFLTEIEVKPSGLTRATDNSASDVNKVQNDEASLLLTASTMETSEVESADKIDKPPVAEGEETVTGKDENQSGDEATEEKSEKVKDEQSEVVEEEEEDDGVGAEGEDCMEGDGREEFEGEDDEDEDTTTLSSEAVVDDIELILMPEMCHDMSSANLSPKLVRVTELKLNADDVFCDDETDEEQSSRHEFRSIVDEVCEEEDGGGAGQHDSRTGRLSAGDDDASSGSELISSGRRVGAAGESSKSSSSSGGRRRRSTSGRINSGVQTDITAVEEPTPLSSGHGFRKKSSGKSSARLGIPGGSANGKKLNWKSELTLLPSKMKVKQSGFNSFESNDERDQYSPRVAKFTSQDTLNLSSQFLKPSTLYRTRNLSRNLNQFASSESTFMLPMSSEQQLSSCGVGESPRFRDRVSSSTSGTGVCGVGGAGNFKGTATSYSAYQISSMLSGGAGGGVGMGTPLSSARLSRHPHQHAHQPLISGYSGGGAGHMMMMSSRQFRSSMPDLNAVNKSYAAVAAASMADSHRRRQPSSSKSIKHSSSSRHRHPHHHSSTSSAGGFRPQKRSSSDEETSSLIDESERCLRSSIDLLLTDELPSPGGILGAGDSSCFRSSGFGGSSAANVGGPGGFYSYSSRRSCSQPILNDLAYPPEMKDPSMGSPFLPRKLSDMRCSRWAKVILPNGHVAVVSVKETDEIQDSLTVHTDTGCVINLPFRKVVFAWRSTKR